MVEGVFGVKILVVVDFVDAASVEPARTRREHSGVSFDGSCRSSHATQRDHDQFAGGLAVGGTMLIGGIFPSGAVLTLALCF